MAMTMTGEVQLSASRASVWDKLNDPEVLKQCVPGCEQLDLIGDNEFQAVATVKVGPVKARWKGKIKLSDFDPPNSYRITGEGEGGVAGFAKGGAVVSLADKDGGTLLVLQRRGPDRRQARPARPTPDQQRRQEDRGRFLRAVQSCGCGITAGGRRPRPRPLTAPAPEVQS